MTPALSPAELSERLARWLKGVKPQWQDLVVRPREVTLGAGFSGEILFADVSYREAGQAIDRSLVIRRQSHSVEVVYGTSLTLQADMMAALDARGDVPVPAWIGMETDPAVLGAPFLVMGEVDGRVATQRPNYNVEGWLTEISPAQRNDAFTQAIQALATLHAIDWKEGFQFLDRGNGQAPGLEQYIGNLVDWHRSAGGGRRLPILDTALQWVLDNMPKDAETCVLWGDPTPSNTMWRADGTLAALIDWELAALGPRELDLAWWLYFDDLFSRRFGVQRLEGLPSREETIAIYERASGKTVSAMDYYDVVVALRMALVALGAFDRQVAIGNIQADNISADNNLMTLYLAEKLNLPLPVLGDDFRAFMRNLTPVKEEA